MHISPITVLFLRKLGHDVIRVNEILSPSASDKLIEDDVKKGSIISVEDNRVRIRKLPF
ncbi:MAG: hypothetical protein Q8N09_05330 [Thermodesulfovibrionia bacterium]|nr:hypothetical protein [Thermodesulfovibrionia bacterium]